MKPQKNGLDKKSKTTSKLNTLTPSKTKKPLLPLKKIEINRIPRIQQKSLTPIKQRKPLSHIKNQSMSDIESSDLMEFEQWNTSEKIKKDILKKYKELETQVQTLKRKEKEMGSKMIAMKKRETEINEAKNKKNQFKNEVKENKELKKKKLNLQKEQLKNLRDYEHNRQLTLQEMTSQKRKLIADISKSDHNLMKTMLSQTISKKDAVNKCLYLKEKEHKENFKKNIKNLKEKNDTNKRMMNKKKYEKNLSATETLKDKCKQLEKLQKEYRNLIKDEQIKASCIEHPINYMNHTFYKGNQQLDASTLTLNSGSYIHYTPIKRRNRIPHTPERSTVCDSKRHRMCKTPVVRKKKL